MVAILVMALLALLSWRGLDGMARAQSLTQARADQVLTVQAALAQWTIDLDSAEQVVSQSAAMEWDGRGLRMIRRNSAAPGAGWIVVGWSRRDSAEGGQWLRWQSPELWRRGELQRAWADAAQWMQNPSADLRQREVMVLPLGSWQLYYFRENAWTNPLSSAGVRFQPPLPGLPPLPRDPGIPDGVRLQLVLPPGHPLAGTLTRDWVRPTVGGGKT